MSNMFIPFQVFSGLTETVTVFAVGIVIILLIVAIVKAFYQKSIRATAQAIGMALLAVVVIFGAVKWFGSKDASFVKAADSLVEKIDVSKINVINPSSSWIIR